MNRAVTFEGRGELVQLLPGGQLKTLWKSRLPAFPHKVFLSSQGHVVLLDTHAGSGQGKNALVIYSSRGELIANYDFNTVVPDVDDRKRFYYALSGFYLSSVYTVRWATYAGVPHLTLRDRDGKGPTINLTTGEFKTVWNGQSRR
ncbi:hypothetical protein V3W47_12345 [Deinococcus sp. YIM 134068]|uniref:hypothetical protein n=1 Tax=Deinococcus lichenicola TaxID=3118910 RepID=UPI002F94CEF9